MRQLMGCRLEGRSNVCALLDGDQREKRAEQYKAFVGESKDKLEPKELREWFESRVSYLPGKVPPERWVVEQMDQDKFESFEKDAGLKPGERIEMKSVAERVEHHSAFAAVAENLRVDEENVRTWLLTAALHNSPECRMAICGFVEERLKSVR